MVQFNLALREINCKVVYFGPGLSGKTTNLEVVHQKAPEESRGVLSSIATESDRTLFFDFMPLNLGTVGGMKTKFQLYTVPGQVYYNSTRKLVLRGADGVVFVADSNPEKMAENLESLQNLEDCLREQGRSLADTPHVIQFNKRDLPNVMSCDEMGKALNRYGMPCFEAVASKGTGVIETFKGLSMLVLQKVKALADERQSSGGRAPAAGGGGAASAGGIAPRPTMAMQSNAPPGPVAAPSVATVDAPPAPRAAPPIVAGKTPGAMARPAVAVPAVRQSTPSSESSYVRRPTGTRGVSTSQQRMIVSSSRPRSSVSPAMVWIGAVVVGVITAGVVLFLFRR